ncbi:MAG: VOC family protein [Peptostreptococcaceae bacterium]|nr:VOC family protein [Peptostreptococcaceae bacterium]
MRAFEIKNVVSVFQVSDMDRALSWYQKWLGEPDVIPMEGVAEYALSESAWLQLSVEEKDKVEGSSIVIGVEDIHKCHEALEKVGIEVGEIIDYEVVLVFDIQDVDGNRIAFAQEVE